MTLPASVLEQFAGKSILVTGGTGLIGCQIVKLVRRVAKRVVVASLDAAPMNPSIDCYGGIWAEGNYVEKRIDLCRQVEVEKLFENENFDFVFHVAGMKGSVEITLERPASFFVPLMQMNLNVFEECRKAKSKPRVLYTSSIGAYPPAEAFVEPTVPWWSQATSAGPMDRYPGWAKRMGELQIDAYRREYGLDWTVVRLANVYGPGDNFASPHAMVIPSLMRKIFEFMRLLVTAEECGPQTVVSPVEIWGDGTAVRDFAYSEDIAEGCMQAILVGSYGFNLYNLGSGVGVSIRDLVNVLQQVVGNFPFRFESEKATGFSIRVMSISLARKRFGWRPSTSLEVGLRKTWDWYCKHSDEKRVDYFERS